MDKIKQQLLRIDELNIKERGLILLSIVLACYMMWDTLLMQPLDLESVSLQQKIDNRNKEILALKQQIAAIVIRSTEDPDADSKQTLASLAISHQQADQALNQATEHLIAADRMALVLEEMLLKTSGLRFVSMKGLGVAPLIEPTRAEQSTTNQTAAAEGEKTSVIGAFKHGLQIQFEGGYQETLNYLKALEQLQWSFFWHSVDYSVEQYPTGMVTITVYTLSLKNGWIDV